MVKPGDAFFFTAAKSHLWFVVTQVGPDNRFVIVNITTLRESEVDTACILHPSEYESFITVLSAVRYRDAREWWVEGPKGFDDLRRAGMIRTMPRVDDAVLKKIQDAALISPFTPRGVKRRIASSLGRG